jgi:hypothetical protein
MEFLFKQMTEGVFELPIKMIMALTSEWAVVLATLAIDRITEKNVHRVQT